MEYCIPIVLYNCTEELVKISTGCDQLNTGQSFIEDGPMERVVHKRLAD